MLKKSLWAALLLGPGLAWAQGMPVGFVKTVSGDALVITQGEKQKAVLGSKVYQGSQLQTGAKSSIGVTFKDETVISLGPDTSLTVDEYVYAPADKNVKFGSKLAKGTLNYISGGIAKLKPESVTIGTPTGTIGVRGTHFVAKVE